MLERPMLTQVMIEPPTGGEAPPLPHLTGANRKEIDLNVIIPNILFIVTIWGVLYFTYKLLVQAVTPMMIALAAHGIAIWNIAAAFRHRKENAGSETN